MPLREHEISLDSFRKKRFAIAIGNGCLILLILYLVWRSFVGRINWNKLVFMLTFL